MHNTQRSNSLQTYQVVLYNRPLHPELFGLKGRRVHRHGAYELESWLMAGGHVMRFQLGGHCITELVTDQPDNLPDMGVKTAFLCAGERDYDCKFERERATYITTVQTEQLSENLYRGTFDEMSDYAAEVDGLVHRWDDDAGPNLSLLDIQRFNTEVHAQSYHLLASGGIVLRTQTIFEQM